MQKGCDPAKFSGGGNESARSAAEAEIRPYFPGARAVIEQTRQTLVVYTCATLGKAAVDTMPAVIQPKMKAFETVSASLARAFGLTTFSAFELGFPQDAVRYDISSRHMQVVSADDSPGYAERYDAICGSIRASTGLSPTVLKTSQDVFIFIGNFQATVTRNTDGREIKTNVRDTLGLYREADFEHAKEQEINSRMQIISTVFAQQGMTLQDLKFISVERIPFR